MKITHNFLNFYWGAIINDIQKNLKELVWNNIRFNLKALEKESIHKLLKIITFKNISLSDMTSKEVVKYLEDIRSILADNGYVLKIDNEEWERVIKSIRSKK